MSLKMRYHVTINGKVFDVTVELVYGTPVAALSYAPAPVAAAPIAAPAAPAAAAEEYVLSPMPGNIGEISVSVGQSVAAGQCLIVLESMKIKKEIAAPRAGVVKQVLVAKGASVETSDILVVLI